MIARTGSQCVICGQPIVPGQNIVPAQNDWAHISCKYGE